MAEIRELQRDQQLKEIESKKEEIARVKHVNEVMKHVIRSEQEENMKMFLKYNKEEKELMSELRMKGEEKLSTGHLQAK